MQGGGSCFADRQGYSVRQLPLAQSEVFEATLCPAKDSVQAVPTTSKYPRTITSSIRTVVRLYTKIIYL